ncbi:hypothetical protein PRVXT_000698 [Proteinivorax tanatarense]|uniref:Uncharacterized protein n=1 Tax=Proteinivorax tanatarense TaxID=1260629 RepID=A0AAU7VNR0_9FIRM
MRRVDFYRLQTRNPFKKIFGILLAIGILAIIIPIVGVVVAASLGIAFVAVVIGVSIVSLTILAVLIFSIVSWPFKNVIDPDDDKDEPWDD